MAETNEPVDVHDNRTTHSLVEENVASSSVHFISSTASVIEN